MLRVTVAICTYNRAPLLRQTLGGVCSQDYPSEALEVLVIDNASTDETPQVVAEFAAAPHPPRRIEEREPGLNVARNRAIAEARGEVIVFADDDILPERDWVRELAKPFERDTARTIGCVGGEVIPVFPDGCPDWIAASHRPLAFRSDAGPIAAHQTPMGANLAVARWVLARTGPFAAGLDRRGNSLLAGGDREFIARVRAVGAEVWFAPAAAVRHQMPARRTTLRYAARHAFDSARSRVIEKAHQRGAAPYLASRLLAHLVKAPLFALNALLCAVVMQRDGAKLALVRTWRSCGYLFQIARSALRLD